MSWIKDLKSSNNVFPSFLSYIFTGLRILIGWHFLYEGLSKIMAANWSASGYLMESHWIFSSFFHWIASSPLLLTLVNIINSWGLIIIGLFLFMGLFTRITSTIGAGLLLLYYIAQPPLVGFMGEITGEGHYLIINKVLIEFAILSVFVFLPTQLFFGLDRWMKRITNPEESETTGLSKDESRREFLKDLVAVPFLGGFALSVLHKRQWESFEERHLISQPSRVDATTGASPVGLSYNTLTDLKEKSPWGKIGDFEISRLICGGNLISGFAHSRDLIYVSSLIQSYFNDEKVLETMRLCELCGINTIVLRVDANTLRIMEKYRRRNGKMHWIAQTKIQSQDIRSDIDAAVDNGAMAAYIHGGVADECVAKGEVDLLHKAIDYVKSRGVLAGMAGHNLNVIIECERAGVDPDFYMKTLNSGNYWTAGPRLIEDPDWQPDPVKAVVPEYNDKIKDNIWSVTPEQTVSYMQTVKKPWIAYKVLGAGAIKPHDGFKYAFESGADFACVGMFDFQVVEDVNKMNEVLKGKLIRKRSWYS
jgi:uncharacterized membrane protein YphA (DoxX/SURF4 family)